MAWFVARLAIGREEEIVQISPSAYVPRKRVTQFNRRQRVWKTFDQVRFPGYVFVTESPRQRTSFYFGCLRDEFGAPFPVRDDVVDRIKRIEAQELSGVARFAPKRGHNFSVGDAVRFPRDHALSELIGTIESLSGPMGVCLSISDRATVFRVQTDATRIRPAA